MTTIGLDELLPVYADPACLPPDPPDNEETRQQHQEADRRELAVVATLLHEINKDHRPLADAIVQRVFWHDLTNPDVARLFKTIQDVHARGGYVDRTAIENYAREEFPRVDNAVLDRVFASDPITDRKQLDHYLDGIVRAGAMRKARAAVQRVDSALHYLGPDTGVDLVELADRIQGIATGLKAAHRRAAAGTPMRPLTDELAGVVTDLAATHGREFIGLATGTMPTLDRYTLGLRGFMLMAAAPGEGKTTLGLQLGLDIVEHNPDAAFVFFSFEMARADMYRRLLSMVSGLRWKTILLGSHGVRKFPPGDDGLRLTADDRAALDQAIGTLQRLGNRVVILDQQCLEIVDYEALASAVTAAKSLAGVPRAYVLVDSLQAIPFQRPDGIPWSNDVERDNYVIGQLLRLQRTTGDALVVVSEQNKAYMGRDILKSIRGTARGVYTPDCVIFLQSDERAPSEDRDECSYVQLRIAKGRDGVYRGTIDLRFHYERHEFEEASADGRSDVIRGPSL